MTYKIIRRGVDTLDVAFQGRLPLPLLGVLRAAKAQAASSGLETLTQVGEVTGHVKESGAQGGYAFIFDTGPHGEIWTFKDNSDNEQWNIRVSVRALQLALDGYETVRDGLWAKLEGWGAQILSESISRIDFAIDFAAEDLKLRPDDFVFHSHSRCQEHRELPEDGSGFAIERRSGRVTGITVGKQPGRQVAVYDKTLEQNYKVGSPWFGIWGYEKADCPRIWRVETRAGKKYLKEWGVTTFEDLEHCMVEMFAAALQSVRMTAGRDLSNVSRSDDHPFWQLARREVEKALRHLVPDVDRHKIMNYTRSEIQEMYRKQLTGLQVSYAVAMGLSKQEAVEGLMERVTGDWMALAKGSPAAFGKKFKAANDRLHFLKEGEPSYGEAVKLSGAV